MATKKNGLKQEAQELRNGNTVETTETIGNPANSFPIVGMGASAGGLAAFSAFFSGMPVNADPGVAFVLVQHMAPDCKSILACLIRRHTRMQVFEVEDGMEVQPNCAYIIPPNSDMAFLNGTLQLMGAPPLRGRRLPIDFFFCSLARELHGRAICVVLSGTGSDGTLGVRAVKGEGGMVMAQKPESAEYDSMPRSAIGTGLVDYELQPAEMPARIMAYVANAFVRTSLPATAPAPKAGNALKKIFIIMQGQTGHDFSQYKPSTIYRRIERRMAAHKIGTMDGYVKFLQQTPPEVEALFRDLLIGVTSFFRDPEAFRVIEGRVMPDLFAGKPPGAAIRVWVPGCSSGEEAYSLAILLAERSEASKKKLKVQVFATDIDCHAVATARAGLYPAGIAADVSPQRLARFFTPEPGNVDGSPVAYRIRTSIRDTLVFSGQSLTKDPPFSKIDLISCRNTLIYMGGNLQRRLIPFFHYALNPGGFLFLGTSETVGEYGDLFDALDRKAKVYKRNEDYGGAQRTNFHRFLPPMMAAGRISPPSQPTGKKASPAKPPLRELTEQALLQQLAPAGVLVNGRGDILYIHGRTSPYLELPQGEVGVLNILKMAQEGLRHQLASVLRKAVRTRDIVLHPGIRIKTSGDFSTLNLTVRPVIRDTGVTHDAPLYLVILEETAPFDHKSATGAALAEDATSATEKLDTTGNDGRVSALRRELRAKDEYLRSANKKLETSNEALRSSNDELQAINEELQATNEELETSKEELQAVNEELATVNAELQTKVADLSRSNNDMNNLLAGTGIATVFVDHQLRILRFTPTATRIINLIPGDMGRHVGHIVSNLVGYDRLVADVMAVLDTLVPKEIEVQTAASKWYTMRIQPYRTLDNQIEGVVITFTDIPEMVLTREALKKTNGLLRLAVMMGDAHDAVIVQDVGGRIIAWNLGAVRMYGWTEAEALEMNLRDRIPERLKDDALAKMHQLSQTEFLEPCHSQRIARDNSVLDVSVVASALVNEAGLIYAIAAIERVRSPKNNPKTRRCDEKQG